MKKMLLNGVIAGTLFFCSSVIFGQAPNLGSAANFVLFTTVGAVGNTGTSQLTGNVGSNSGSSTGFGNVNGGMHDNDLVSGAASADLAFAYNQLNLAIATFFPAPLLGNGDTLIAGVYRTTAVTTLSSNLYLDAKGDANAVFIFQIQAAFSTLAASKVKLINGALACNVFWKVEGLVDMATQTSMKGTVIANNAAIQMATLDTLEGRALSTSGAVAVNGVLAYLPTGCGSPLLTGPAAPVLGSAECYAIFSGNGAVANAGVTHVTGDVGTNVGLTSGFDALLVNGSIHPIPDVSTAACAADLLIAYNYLNLLPTDIELLYPAQFGHNLVLTPHVYLMNAATSFTDTLYLNAQGVPNAVFVIKIKGALSTSTFSKVILINGTQAKNVYWMVDGAVTISDNSIFNGTIVCNNAAIDVTTGTTINGRALTTNGALGTAAIVTTSPFGACAPLPLTWLYFRGKPVAKNVLLEWGTENELNNSFFTLEKSMDGLKFETLAIVNATKAIENAGHEYSFTDKQPFNITYYRISQTDKDAHNNPYKTIQVKLYMNQGLAIHPYVLGNYLYVQTSGAVPGSGSMVLYGVDGKKITSQKIVLARDATTYKIDKALVKGMYLLFIESQGEKLFTGKVIAP